ncbi:NUDIX domain-containing protein [Candidatus Peregrinibacteria bacterium]|nr:NUDIX domain-containing protein [Candidatus Peregrinibacteria bacterium]
MFRLQPGHSVIITNAAGEYLMQFRDGAAGIHDPLTWDFFGGAEEEGESHIEAAVRELQEELGIEIQPAELTVVTEQAFADRDDTLIRCSRPLEWGQFTVLEGAGCAFLSREELLRLQLSQRVRFIAEKYL